MDAGERGTTVEALAAELAQLRSDIDTRVQKEVTRQLSLDHAAAGSAAEGAPFTANNPLSRTSAAGDGPAASVPPAGAALQLGAPRSLNSASAAICTAPDQDPGRRNAYALSCLLIAVLQSTVMVSVYKGVSEPSCFDFSDCPVGYYCAERAETGLGECRGCLTHADRHGQFTKSPDQGTWGNATAFCSLTNISEYSDGIAGCSACYDAGLAGMQHGDGWNVGKTETEVVVDSLAKMRGGDVVAFILVAGMVGMHVSNEWSDIKLCEFLMEQRCRAEDPRWVRRFFWALAGLRQFGFLPLLTATVPMLVAHRGSTALEVCFNGVAIIFLLELEYVSLAPSTFDVHNPTQKVRGALSNSNAIYGLWLSHATRVELDQSGCAQIGEKELRVLGQTNRAHAVLVTTAILSGTLVQRQIGVDYGKKSEIVPYTLSLVAFAAGALVEWQNGKVFVERLGNMAVGLASFGFVAAFMGKMFGL